MASHRVGIAGLALFAVVLGTAYGQGGNQHNGQVHDADDKTAVFARVSAYTPGTPQDKGGDCPTFGKPLNQTNSNQSTGNFILTLEKTPPAYDAVYCANAYTPRVDRSVPNTGSEPVIPTPVPLVKRTTNVPDMDRIVNREFRAFMSNLRYFRQVNQSGVDQALEKATGAATSPDERQLIDALRRTIAAPPAK